MFIRFLAVARVVVVLSCLSIQGAAAKAKAEPLEGTVAAYLRASLDSLNGPGVDAADLAALRSFYLNRDYGAVWVDEAGPTRAATLILAELGKAETWGLDGAAFQIGAAVKPMLDGRWTAVETADAELEISSLVLRYARHARGGRITDPESQLTTYLDRAPRLPDPAAVLSDVTRASDPGAVLSSYQPRHAQFLKLKDYYARLLNEQKRQQDLNIGLKGEALLPGKSYTEIAVLRQRFGVAVSAGLDEQTYDESLAATVKQFQAAMSLKADGIVGPATRKALNVNVADKIAAVAANMEQWRWMPEDLGAKHIFVNVPAYSVDFMQDGVSTFRDRVIVGTESTQTPIFSKNMTTIVVRPEWYLPDSIKVTRLLSGRALESQGLKVKKNGRIVDSSRINWSKANLNIYTIYQPSGGGNALGSVKFLFPNKHSVYLHDTPNKSLFNASDRNFSHGCVRVRNPLILAQHLFDADRGPGALNAAKLASSGPESNEITLQTPIPVHIANFTVWIDDDGKAQFLGDRYGHQKRIVLALSKRWKEIDRGKDHLAAVDVSALEGLSLRPRKRPNTSTSTLTAPAGLTTSPQYYGGYRSYDNGGVGELIRRAFSN